jgi:ribose-phosphate pyrophosphokinase
MHAALGLERAGICRMSKERSGERRVEIRIALDSPVPLAGLAGKDVVIFDDMVRTGSTIVKACQALRQGKPRRVLFCVSHFYSSEEGRENLAASAIDEILTLNTLPSILNRDRGAYGGRWWCSRSRSGSRGIYAPPWLRRSASSRPISLVDMSSKNPRWKAPLRPIAPSQLARDRVRAHTDQESSLASGRRLIRRVSLPCCIGQRPTRATPAPPLPVAASTRAAA